MKERYAGVLLPITALPSPYGVGTLGAAAKSFVEFLVKAKQKIWQVLPLVPTGYGDSPYASSCAIAGSPYLIDIDNLIEQGLLTKEEAEEYSCASADGAIGRVNYEALFYRRIPLLKLAFSRFDRQTPAFKAFLAEGEYADFAAFMAIKEHHDWRALSTWEEKYRVRDQKALDEFLSANADEVLFWQFTQYEFFRQWKELKDYANTHGVEIMGDMPLYVSEDSAEVWAHPELFLLNGDGAPTEVAGVPPDYFSEDGQLWGNPLYDWDAMKQDGYAWWQERMRFMLELFDGVRIDHFRGLESYFSIPAGETTAKKGKWVKGPGMDLIRALQPMCKNKLMIAEDLGDITPEVQKLVDDSGFPGMRVLQFAFLGEKNSPHLPHNYSNHCVAYTGTHDNNTLLGYVWEQSDGQRRDLLNYCGFDGSDWDQSYGAILRTMFASHAGLLILPVQDLLLYGADTRINTPGNSDGNWSYRITREQMSGISRERFRALNNVYGRA